MSSFTIKMIAIFAMTLDHFSTITLHKFTFLNMIGRFAFPLFAFQFVISFRKTKNLNKMAKRLLLFSIISQPFYYLATKFMHPGRFPLNVFFTFFFGLICMHVLHLEKVEDLSSDVENNNYLISRKLKYNLITLFNNNAVLKVLIKSLIIFSILVLARLLNTDYNYFGILLMLIISITYKGPKMKLIDTLIYVISFTLWLYLFYAFQRFNILLLPFYFIGLSLTLFFNGKKGQSMKYFFYIYYPLHLFVLYLIRLIIAH